MGRQIVLPDEELASQIGEILGELRARGQADCAILADMSGQLIEIRGEAEGADPVLVAALAAGEISAMNELARQIGDRSPSRCFLHEGERRRLYICDVSGTFVLIVIFSADAPVGLVRLFVRRAAERLAPLANRFEELVRQDGSILGADFSTALSEELDRAFGGM